MSHHPCPLDILVIYKLPFTLFENHLKMAPGPLILYQWYPIVNTPKAKPTHLISVEIRMVRQLVPSQVSNCTAFNVHGKWNSHTILLSMTIAKSIIFFKTGRMKLFSVILYIYLGVGVGDGWVYVGDFTAIKCPWWNLLCLTKYFNYILTSRYPSFYSEFKFLHCFTISINFALRWEIWT